MARLNVAVEAVFEKATNDTWLSIYVTDQTLEPITGLKRADFKVWFMARQNLQPKHATLASEVLDKRSHFRNCYAADVLVSFARFAKLLTDGAWTMTPFVFLTACGPNITKP